MANDWTPPSDGVVSKEASFTPPSDAVEVKKKDLTVSGLGTSSSDRLTTTTTKATVSSSSKERADGLYSFPGRENATYKKENGQWFVTFDGSNKYIPLQKGDIQARVANLEKNAVSLSSRRWDDVTVEPISKPKYRTDDYIDKVQNAQKKVKATNQNVKSTFEQPKETKPPIKFEGLSEKEAMQIMAEDFGKKEFELYSKISDIDKNVFEQGETEAVKYLNDQFKGSGFVFEETGVGNAVRIKSTLNDGFGTVVNEKVVELPTTLFPTMGAEKSKAAEQSMKEISDFMNQAFLKKSEKEFLNKDVKDYGQLVKLAVTNPQKYGESFLNQYDVERWIDKQYIDLVIEGKSIKREQQLLEQETKAYQESGVFNEETERMLRGRAANLQNQVTANTQKYEEMKDITARLPQAAAVYFQKKEKEGNLAGLVSRSLLGGILNMEKMLITTAADVVPLIIQPKSFSSIMIPEAQQVRLKAAGMTDAQIKDYAAKQLRKGIVKEALQGVDDFVSLGTTDEYIQSKDRNDLEKVVNFLGESVGTAISAGGNPILQSLAFFSQSYNAMEEEMNSPEFDGLTQMEKKLMSVPYGLVIGQLDKLGFNISKNVAKSPLFNKLVTNTIARAFTSVPKDASIDVMQKTIEESLTATMARAGLNIVGGSLVEGTTEGTQSLAEYTMKNIYNNVVADKDVFQNVPDITTKEGFKKAVSAAGEEFYYGALGGAIMGAGGSAIESLTKGFNKGEKEFDFFEKVINDPNLRALIETDIKTKITSGELTKAEAKEQIDAINKSVSILNKMPENLPSESKMQAYNLILERSKIEKEIAGKDPALVAAQTERVSAINDKLKQLSYAVQEQATSEVPVQPGAESGGEMAQGESEAGPQEVTQEGEQAQEVNELQTVRDRILKIEEAKKKGELLEGSQPGELKSLKQRESELVQKIEKPIMQETTLIEEQVKQPELNIVNNENINDVIERQDTETKQKIAKSAKLAIKAIPKAKIYLHNNTAEYDAAVGEQTEGKEKGSFIASNGAIHINMSEAFPHTLLHEAFHYVVLNKGLDAAKLNGWVKGLRSIVKDKKLLNRLDNLLENYSAEEQAEEFISELGSIMGAAKGQLSTNALQKFKTLINKIAKSLGLPIIFTSASTKQEAVDFINTISKQLVTGEEIEVNEPGTGGEIGTFNVPKRKLQKTIRVSEDPRDFIRKFVEDINIREFNGKKFITNMYDYTNAGDTDLGNGFKITMLGGKNYVPLMMELNGKVIGDVSNLAAFNTREQAETFIRNAELGGANLFAPHAGTLDQSWQFQQHTFAELFNLVLDNDILTPKELIDVFNNTIKDSKDNQKQFNQFATKYGEDIKNFDSFESDPKKIIDLLDIKNNYSPKLRKALNNAIASNKKFQQAIGVKNKNEFYNRIMDPLNQGMKGGEIMNIVDFDPTTFQIVETKPNNTDHHPSFGFALLAKINGIYQPTELVKSVDITDSYTKYNQDGEKTSRKAEEPKFEEKNVSSSAGAIPKTAEFNIPSTRKKQLIGKNAYLSKNVKDNLSVAKKMEADKKSPIDIRIATGWEKGVDNKWRYEIEDIKINNKLKDLSKGVIKTKNTSTPIPLSQVISKSNALLTAYPKLADTFVIVTKVIGKSNSVLGAHGLIDGKDIILLKAIEDYDLMESTLVHEIQHGIQEIEGFAKGTNVANTYKTKIALDRAVKLAAAEQKALDRNISFLSKGINTYDKLWAYFVDYIKENLTSKENYDYVINKLGGESNLDLSNDYVIEYLKENSIPDIKNQKSLINMFEAKKLYDQVSGGLGYLSTAGEVESRNVEARRKMSAKERLNTLLSETENIPRSRQIIDGKIARKKQLVYNASPRSVEELGKRSGVVYFATDKREANAYAEGNRGQVREFEIPQESISNEKVVLDKINELGLQPKDKQYNIEESNLYELIDDRFDNSLSQSDINKLFDALKKDGVTAFRYKDGAQVVEGTTESIAVIDTDVVQKSVRKKQLTTDKDAKPGYETALDALGETEAQREEWRKKNKVNQKQKRNPVVEQAVKDYYNEEISQEEYLDIVSKNQPIKPFKEVPDLPSLEDITNSLDSSKVATGIIGLTKNIEEGEKVASRLDIPAYEDYDTWVVSVHDGVKEGKSLAYGQTAVLKNVEFKTNPTVAINIASAKVNARGQVTPKSTIARMFGNWVNEDPESVHARAKELMNDPAWTQVGMNPFRYSWFYDKADGMPLASAEEVVQVGALVLAKNAVKVSPSDPMFETKSAKGGKIKFQKGFSKQEAIRKAKEKYVLSVKERGNTPEQGVTSALEDLRKSEWYNEADDLMREEAERELKKFFGEKMKAAPSIKKVMAIKPTKIQVEEMAALKSQIRLEAKAAREAKGDLNAKRKALAAAITGMVRQGKITAVQARSIINKVSRVNLDNPVMVDRLISYAERVFDRADYQETLSKAAKIRKSIKKAMKSKDLQAEVAGMAKKFSGVDPFMVEDIDQYIENAEKVLNAVRPVRETEVPLRQAADIESISEYTTAQVERQEANKKAELLALNKYLVEAGIVTDDMTAKEIQEMIDIIAAEEYEVENADKKLNFLKNRFDFMAGVVEEMIVNNRDIFTDEALDLTQSQKELMREVLKFDIDKLSVKQAAQVLEAMDNFINNGITSGLKAVVNNYIGNETANKLAASGLKSRPLKMYWNKAVGKFFGEQFVSLPLLIERMFPGMNKGLKLMSDMGLTNVIRGAAKADREHKMIVKDYTNQEFYKGKGFMKAENVYERGMIAFLSRNLAGTKTEMRNEFLRRIKMVEESINALMNGSETERKMGEVYQQVFDKLKVNSQDLDIIKANAEQMNLDSVDWMTQQWAEKYSDLSDVSLSVYNAILGSDTNYTPDRYKALDEADIELDENLLQKGSAFMGGLEYTDKNKSGVLIETTRPKALPKGRFVSLDFDVNNFSSLKGAMIDIETAPAIRQVDGFIKSDGYKKIVNGDDRKIITGRINNYIIKVKGKTAFTRDSMRSVERLANFLGSLGVGKALGGFDQTIKQTAPVIINTLINAGRFDGLNMEMNEAINRSGMPIANRGIEAVSGVDSVDALIDKKGATAAEIAKSIEKVSQIYMKALLSKPDVWVARSSFISYYKNYLKTNGMSTDIDWKTHEWNQDAMDYAQMMVDRQQNISDEKLAGSFISSPDPWKSVTRKVMLPFATFIINQKNRMHNDFVALFGIGAETSLEDKKKAARSLIGLSAEMLAYQSIAYFIKTMVYDKIASYITGEDEEEEKKDKSFFGIKMTSKEWNATKFPVKSLISDIVSPFPLLDDGVVFSFDKLMSNFPMISDEDIKKAIQDKNDSRALKGEEPMNSEQEANLIQSLKDKNTYKVAFQNESLGRQYGVPGIAFDTYTELAEMSKLAYTGEFEDDTKYGPKLKHISKSDQEIVKWTLLPMMMYSTGLLPKDAGVVSRKVVNNIKKRAISDNKFKNTNELKTELGRKPKEWEESLVMNTTKKIPTLVEAIKFAERFANLTPVQSEEYVKVIKEYGDYDFFILQALEKNVKAEDIIKSIKETGNTRNLLD